MCLAEGAVVGGGTGGCAGTIHDRLEYRLDGSRIVMRQLHWSAWARQAVVRWNVRGFRAEADCPLFYVLHTV